MSLRIVLDRAWAAEVLQRMPPDARRRVKTALRDLQKDPFPGNDRVKVRQLDLEPGRIPVYRARVGDWRVIYQIDGCDVLVLRIMRREEGYEWLE